ncbi:MAG: ATP-binding protein [Elusimicrobiota bacterium]|nr:ATP-binding protein [Elusimicrobiota bacterium]
MKKLRMGFFAKFLTAVAFITLVPLLFMGIKLIDINRVALKRMVMERHMALASGAAYRVDSYFTGLSKSLRFLAQAYARDMLSGESRIRAVKAFISSSESIESVALVSLAGREKIKFYNPAFAEDSIPADYQENGEFKSALAGSPSLGRPYLAPGGVRINAAYPAAGEILFITVSLDELFSEIQKIGVGRSGRVLLVDGEGRILASGGADRDIFGSVMAHPLIAAFLGSRVTGARDFVSRGTKMSGAYEPVEIRGWAVIVEEPYEDAYYSLFLMKRNAVLWLAAAALAALGMAFFAAKSVTRPVRELIAAASGIASGNFSRGVRVSSHDEIGELAKTFNEMSARLKEYNEMQIDKLLAEKTKTEAVIFSIFDGLILTDYEGRILLANAQAERILGLPGLEEGKRIADYMKTGDRELKSFFEDVSKNRDKNIVREFSFAPSAAGVSFAKAQTASVRTKDGREIGTVTVFRDISIEKELDGMKEFFMQAIAHDLRNSLTSISGFIDLMSMKTAGGLNAKQEHYLSAMAKETERLQAMINDILDAAKLEAGQMMPVIKNVPVNFLAANAIEGLTGMALGKGVELKSEMPPKSPRIDADGELVQRVIVNLIANGIKFTPAGGSVLVRVSENDRSSRVEVKDTGQGMPKDSCVKIFDKFQRLPGALSGGTGIGLTISREIVKAHSGKIWAESEMGKGSSFIFEIPKNPEDT